MTRVAVRRVGVIDDWEVPDVNETPIVARDKQGLVRARHYLVNMRAVLARRVHTVDRPAELACGGSPLGVLRVRETGRVVALLSNVKVELLVGAADRADVGGVRGPIEGRNERVVLCERFVESVGALVAHGVDVEVVVVRGKGEELLVGGVADHFAPFLCVLQTGDLSVKIVEVTNGDFAHVAANDQMVVFG